MLAHAHPGFGRNPKKGSAQQSNNDTTIPLLRSFHTRPNTAQVLVGAQVSWLNRLEGCSGWLNRDAELKNAPAAWGVALRAMLPPENRYFLARSLIPNAAATRPTAGTLQNHAGLCIGPGILGPSPRGTKTTSLSLIQLLNSHQRK